MYSKEDFEGLLKEWYDIVINNIPYHKEADFRFIVTHDVESYCYDAKYGNTSVEPKWILEHCDVIEGRGLWREYFNTEGDLYHWGCRYLYQMIRRYRVIEDSSTI